MYLLAQASTLTFGQMLDLLGFVVGGLLVAGVVVAGGRVWLGSGDTGGPPSLIRSWIAISLVLGLLIFSAASLWIADGTVRSTMFGGLIASVSAAVAFYFSSQASDQARSDILKAAVTLSQPPIAPTAFTLASPPPAALNTAYPGYNFAANGVPSPVFVLASGSLPQGLNLASDGTVSGTPTATSGPFTVRAINTAGHVDSDPITIAVN